MTFNAVIPTIGLSNLLPALVDRLIEDGADTIWLPDNGTDPVHGARRVGVIAHERVVLYRTANTIYESWNEAMDASSPLPLAVLNDDIILPPGSVNEALRHLSEWTPLVGFNYRTPKDCARWADAQPVSGTFKNYGIGAFAFVVDPRYCPRVHPGFRWWYGDDDLVARVEAAHCQPMLAVGAPVDHPAPSTSGNQMPWREEACTADEILYRSIWS